MDLATLQVIAREINEIIYAAPLLRLRDDDGTEFVARDDLAREVRAHILRRIALLGPPDPRPGPPPLAVSPPASAPGNPGRAGTSS